MIPVRRSPERRGRGTGGRRESDRGKSRPIPTGIMPVERRTRKGGSPWEIVGYVLMGAGAVLLYFFGNDEPEQTREGQ